MVEHISQFGCPDDQANFQKTHAEFVSAIERIYENCIRVFDGAMKKKDNRLTVRTDSVIYVIGRMTLEDFSEIMLLASNGYGIGAQKILRGLYERLITAAYISSNRSAVDDFLDYSNRKI